MATHSSVLAWRIPGMGEPGGLTSMGSQSQTRLMRLSSKDVIASEVRLYKQPSGNKVCMHLATLQNLFDPYIVIGFSASKGLEHRS